MIDIYWMERPVNTIMIEVVNEWTWEEMQTVVTRGLNMAQRFLQEQTHPTKDSAHYTRIDYIYDLRHANFIARPTFNLSNLCIIARRQLPETGVIAVVTDSVFMRTMFNTCAKFCKEAGQYYYLVPDISHAQWLITVSRAVK